MKSIQFSNVFVQSSAACVGPMEGKGPLGKYFDYISQDLYDGEDSFEKAEIVLLKRACDLALRKKNLLPSMLDGAVGGDLMNQLLATHYFARELPSEVIGVYAACATSSLAIALSSIMIEQHWAKRMLAFTSSHNATAERQYRFPNEYGVQKKETTTTTVTGAGSILLGSQCSDIRVSGCTFGRIIDWHFMDAADMGIAMAPAAYDTLTRHLSLTNRSLCDYDLILTGDLSKAGFTVLLDLLAQHGYVGLERMQDCGLLIYDRFNQNVFCGGSGSACSMCVTIAYVFERMKKKELNRVLVLATGALLSPVATYQKLSIPCIAHAIEYQRRELG